MAIHKLDLGEFDEIDYNLIAIHTSLADYRISVFHQSKTCHKFKQKVKRKCKSI